MKEDIQSDFVSHYMRANNMRLARRTVLVEGTSDQEFFDLASKLHLQSTGRALLDDDFTVTAAGSGDDGGVNGVIRELSNLRRLTRNGPFDERGRPRYRFLGLLDNDAAGVRGIGLARSLDSSLLEYRDLFRLRPVMPECKMLDPGAVQRDFERANAEFRTLDWELEDLIPKSVVDAFIDDAPTSIRKIMEQGGRRHYELTVDGKERLKRFAKLHCTFTDLREVCDVLLALRRYLMVPLEH